MEMSDTELQYVRFALNYRSCSRVCFGLTLNSSSSHVLSQLPRALKCLQIKHPALRCKLTKAPGFPGGFAFWEDAKAYEIPIVELEYEEGDTEAWRTRLWQDELETQVMRLGEGFVGAFVVNRGGEACDVLLACQHVVCDGITIMAMCQQLMEFLVDPERVPELGEWAPADDVALEETMEKRFRYGAVKRLGLNVWTLAEYLYPVMRPCDSLPLRDESWNLFQSRKEYVLKHRTFIQNVDFTAIETKRLEERCRKAGVTVTTAVSAAFLFAVAEHSIGSKTGKRSDFAISIVTNYRNDLIPPRPGNVDAPPYAGSIPLRLPCPPVTKDGSVNEADVWASARIISTGINSVSLEKKLWFAKQTGRLLKHVPVTLNTPNRPAFCLSSWGRSEISSEFSSKTKTIKVIRALFAQSCRNISLPLISMYSVAGKLYISCMAQLPTYDQALLENMFNSMKKYLTVLIGEPSSVARL